MNRSNIVLLTAALTTGLGACGDSESAGEAAPDASTVARIEASVAYAGDAEGTLVLAAFASLPPMGGPMGLAQVAAPAFPQALVLDALAPGEAHVIAILDVAPASPTQPGPEDLTVWSEPLVLVEGETETITLTLVDP